MYFEDDAGKSFVLQDEDTKTYLLGTGYGGLRKPIAGDLKEYLKLPKHQRNNAEFDWYLEIRKIIVANDVGGINSYGLKRCVSLEEIVFPENGKFKVLDAGVFKDCENLRHVALHGAIEDIRYNTFAGCKQMEYIVIPDSVKKICACAFDQCENLRFAFLPRSLESVEKNAFKECNNLKGVFYHRGAYEIVAEAFPCASYEGISLVQLPDTDVQFPTTPMTVETLVSDLEALVAAIGSEVTCEDVESVVQAVGVREAAIPANCVEIAQNDLIGYCKLALQAEANVQTAAQYLCQMRRSVDVISSLSEALACVAGIQLGSARSVIDSALAMYGVEEGIAEQALRDAIAHLEFVYACDVVFPKYRNLPAVATMCEYLETGRCAELAGPDGAYNLYESEIRADRAIAQLDAIQDSLQDLKNNQFLLYKSIQSIEREISALNSDLSRELRDVEKTVSGIAADVGEIKDSSAATAYFAERSAEMASREKVFFGFAL